MDNEKGGTQGEHRHHRGTVGDELIWHLRRNVAGGVAERGASRHAAIRGPGSRSTKQKRPGDGGNMMTYENMIKICVLEPTLSNWKQFGELDSAQAPLQSWHWRCPGQTSDPWFPTKESRRLTSKWNTNWISRTRSSKPLNTLKKNHSRGIRWFGASETQKWIQLEYLWLDQIMYVYRYTNLGQCLLFSYRTLEETTMHRVHLGCFDPPEVDNS